MKIFTAINQLYQEHFAELRFAHVYEEDISINNYVGSFLQNLIVANNYTSALEIGTLNGRSAMIMAQALLAVHHKNFTIVGKSSGEAEAEHGSCKLIDKEIDQDGLGQSQATATARAVGAVNNNNMSAELAAAGVLQSKSSEISSEIVNKLADTTADIHIMDGSFQTAILDDGQELFTTGLPRVFSIEKNPRYFTASQQNLAFNPQLAPLIELILGDARQILQTVQQQLRYGKNESISADVSNTMGGILTKQQDQSALQALIDFLGHAKLDLIFVDGNKLAYPDYLHWALQHLSPQGSIIFDNIFLYLHKSSQYPDGSPMQQSLSNFLQKILNSPEYIVQIIPYARADQADGLLWLRLKNNVR